MTPDTKENSGSKTKPGAYFGIPLPSWVIVFMAGGLLIGLLITLAAVLAYAACITVQFSGLRKLQSEMVDRNRKDSLQLLRIQNDLNSAGLAMRDMLDASEPYPLTSRGMASRAKRLPGFGRAPPGPST